MSQSISLLVVLSLCIGSIHGSDFSHASLTTTPTKLPSFVKGGRHCLSSSQSVSSFLLQVRGGGDRDPSGFYDEDNKKRSRRDDRYSSPNYDYRDENQNDDYFSQNGKYYEDDERYEDDSRYGREYDDRGARRTPSVSVLFVR